MFKTRLKERLLEELLFISPLKGLTVDEYWQSFLIDVMDGSDLVWGFES